MPKRTGSRKPATVEPAAPSELRFPSERVLRDAVAALLTRLPWGIRMVQILHGPQEAGKDIVFTLQGAFGESILCACVVKNAKITGSVDSSSGALTILHQAKQAFKIPYLGESGEQIPVQRVYVVTPYTLSNETTRSVQNSLDGDVQFIGGSRLFDLFRTYWKDFLADEFEKRLHEAAVQLNEDAALQNVSSAYRAGPIDRSVKSTYVEPQFCRPITSYDFAFTLERFLDRESLARKPGPVAQPADRHRDVQEPQPARVVITQAEIERQRRQVAALTAVMDSLQFSKTSQQAMGWLRTAAELLDRLDAVRRTTIERQLNSSAQPLGLVGGMADLPGELDEKQLLELKPRADAVRDAVENAIAALRNEIRAISVLSDAEKQESFRVLQRIERRALDRAAQKLPDDILKRVQTTRLRYSTQLMDSVPRLLITAAAGHGKTSFCRWHALKDLESYNEGRGSFLPVFVSLHKLRSDDLDSFQKAFTSTPLISALTARRTTRRLRHRFYLDGLDEVAAEGVKDRIIELLRNETAENPDLRFVLTSREYAVGPDLDWVPWVQLDDFNEEQSAELVRKWLNEKDTSEFEKQLRGNPGLGPLLRVPLLATLTILIFRQTRNLPGSRTRLYGDVVDLMLSGWDVAKNVQRASSLTHSNRLREFDSSVVRSELDRVPLRRTHSTDAVLHELVVDGILQRVGDHLYQFPHLSFQEYLAACDLFGDPRHQRAASVLKRFLCGDDWWREVMRFYVSLGSRQEDMKEWISVAARNVKGAPEWIVRQQTNALIEFTKALSPWLQGAL